MKNWIKKLFVRFPFPLLVLACSGSPSAQDAPRDSGAPDPVPQVVDAGEPLELTLGLCLERWSYVEGACTASAPECTELADSYTRRAIRETEHYAGSVASAYEDECPERYDFRDLAQVFEPDGCTIVCAFRFDITQRFQP
jgi:hypothetical protein